MRLKESIDEILTRTDSQFADIFYELLFEQYPELKEFFANTDMRKQKSKLTLALQVVAYQHQHPNAAMADFTEHLGSLHRERGITSQELPKFRDGLLLAFQKFHGHDWSEELGAEWAEALDKAIEMMNTGASPAT